jgi:archaellum component FlaC
MVVKVYGRSDAELEFLKCIDGRFKVFKINSLDDFNKIAENKYKAVKDILDEFDDKIKKTYNKITDSKNEIGERRHKIKELNRKIYARYKALYGKYGPIRTEIKNQITDLKHRKNNNYKAITGLENGITHLYSDIETLKREKNETEINLRADCIEIEKIEKDTRFLKLFKGIWGEKEVIEYVKKTFENENNFFMINSFNLDVLNRAINVNEKTVVEDKIDHILICPKGFFALETKAWSDVNNEELKNVINQLKRTKTVLNAVFKDLAEKTEVILICTKKHLELPKNTGFTSLMLNELGDYLYKKETVFNGDNITVTEVLNMISPYCGDKPGWPTSLLKLKVLFIKAKRFVKSKIRNK